MRTFLLIVCVISYAIALFAFIAGLSQSEMQMILAGVFATCGTVAFIGVAIIERLDVLAQWSSVLRSEAPTLKGAANSERRAVRSLVP